MRCSNRKVVTLAPAAKAGSISGQPLDVLEALMVTGRPAAHRLLAAPGPMAWDEDEDEDEDFIDDDDDLDLGDEEDEDIFDDDDEELDDEEEFIDDE